MQIKIFDVENAQVRINENCLLIPELKAIVEAYADPIPALSFVYFMTDPLGPYGNLPEDKREELVYKDYPGKYTLDDEPLFKAIDKMRLLYETENMRLLKKARLGLEELGRFLSTSKITDGREGNLQAYTMALSRIGKISMEFADLEKVVKNELKARGDTNIGYDELE